MTQNLYQHFMLALCLWREARSCSTEEIKAVACSIRNRVDKHFRGQTFSQVVTSRAQYSSFPWINGENKPVMDANGITWPEPGTMEWAAFIKCYDIAEQVISGPTVIDPTGGATHYYDKTKDSNPPAWAKDPTSRHTGDIGDFRFWIAK